MSQDFPFNTRDYSLSFCHALMFVLEKEGGLTADGGYVDDPQDRGGETKFGISQRAFPHENIADLTIDDAVALYYAHYWLVASCNDLPDPLSLAVFDAAVQHGVRAAIKMLQEVAGVVADGIYGPKTHEAVYAKDDEYLLSVYHLRRARFYARIIKKNPTQSRFIEGWHNRLSDCLEAAWELV
ncbi:glycoside hydrolase family 108 protein [Vibrio algicola]|uniref:Peptidoglycan-binding protein n=1 Tax=Vibrio algicola TaxID=2662262 RepID=A0A5Q0TJ80_9VIBR|nr:N-acetylmuramidase [Vibrio algicola]